MKRKHSHVVGKIVFLFNVGLESVRHFVEIFLLNAANETLGFQIGFHLLQLITKFTKGVDDETCLGERKLLRAASFAGTLLKMKYPRQLTLDDCQQDDDDKEEEGDVEHDAVNFRRITVWRLDFVTYATTGT